jgi:hypothetical protein
MAVLELFDTRYWNFGVKHLHETLVAEHEFRRSYNWLRVTLQAHGRICAATPCGFADNATAFPTTPQGPQPQQKRSIHMVPNADNSVCY